MAPGLSKLKMRAPSYSTALLGSDSTYLYLYEMEKMRRWKGMD